MHALLNHADSPIYFIILILVVGLFSWLCSYLVPFYRRELAIEDKSRLTPLDGLRGILCFAVLCSHAQSYHSYLSGQGWDLDVSSFYRLQGQNAVSLFFCITGFLFWTRAVKLGGNLAPWPFLRGRLFRIVPLYLFSCVLALAVIARDIHWLSVPTIRGLGRMSLLGVLPWGKLCMVNGIYVNAGVTWTLQFEWSFYLLLPALALMVRGNDPRRLWFIAAGTMVLLGSGPILFFFPGILAVYVLRTPWMVQWCRSSLVSLVVIGVMVAFPWLTHEGWGYTGLLATTIIFLPIACGNGLFGLLNLRGLRLMGIASYSVYLLHGIVLFAARSFLGQALHRANGGVEIYWAYIACAGCISLLLSMTSYRWVEWPFIEYEKRTRHSPATAGIVVQAVDSTFPASTENDGGMIWNEETGTGKKQWASPQMVAATE